MRPHRSANASSAAKEAGVALTTASTAGDVSPTTSSAGHLRGHRHLGLRPTATRTLPPPPLRISAGTYVSVRTVSSFRPTTGLSMPRSWRLGK